MVQGISGSGNTGSLKDSVTYVTFYSEYTKYKSKHPESTLSFEEYLSMMGLGDLFLEQIENFLETGDSFRGDGITGNTISANRSISGRTTSIYQGQDEETYYEFDYENGTYTILHGKEEVAQALGLDNSYDYDTINFGRDQVIISDYTFGNLDDGQDAQSYSVNGKYYNVSYVKQEFDIDYILNALLMDPSDPQYQIAKGIFDDLCANIDQWLPVTAQQELDNVAAEYGVESNEYKVALKEILLRYLDQANEWIDDHAHVKNTSSTTDLSGADSSGSSGGTTDGSSGTGNVPEYDKIDVLTTAGLANAYSRGDKRTVESTNNSESNRRKELQEMMDVDLDILANALISSLGTQLTSEMQSYINKAKANVAAKTDLIKTSSKHHGFLNAHVKTLGEYTVKDVADAFFNEFNTLCANNGKSSEQVAAEEKAAEEKAANEKAGYQSLYNTDFNSVASEVGANKDVQVVNPSSAADIQAKAESNILNPIKQSIISKFSGKISESDLQTLLDNAAAAALADCTEWATSSNYVVYTIDSSLLISKFQENVRTIIKNKGYDF